MTPDSSTPPPEAPRFVRFAEPTEGAFSLVLPSDWAVQAGVARDGASARPWFRVVSPGGGAELRSTDPRVPSAYVDPSFGASLPPMGQMVRPYLPPQAFADEYARFFAGELGAAAFQTTDARTLDTVLAEDPRPEIRQKAYQFVQMGGEVGGVAFTCPDPGVSGQVDVLVTRMPGPSGLVWSPIVTALAGPTDGWDAAKAMLLQIAQSYEANPDWQRAQHGQMQQQHRAAMDTIQTYGQINRDNARASAQRLQNDAATSAYVSARQRETVDHRNALNDDLQRRMGNAINGTADLYDPATGTVYHGAPAGFRTYWTDAGGHVVASEGFDNPNPIHFTQATNLDDL